MNKRCFLFWVILQLSIISLSGVILPVYINWDSSDSYLLNNFPDNIFVKVRENYIVHFGIDTLMTNGVRTRLDLTNQEEQLFSQVVIDHAIIDYHHDNLGLELAMKNLGYGKNFFLYNRRSDNPLYNRNNLFEYRWHGISSTVNFKDNQFSAGIGNNKINNNIAEVSYKYQTDHLHAAFFGVYALHDSRYNAGVYHAGTELSHNFSMLNFHTGFTYQFYPKSQFYSKMESWHLINELGLSITPGTKIILSTDHQTIPYSKKTEFVAEACLALRLNQFQSYFGVNEKTILQDKAYTYFADVNWNILKNLSLGLFFDYLIYAKDSTSTRIGIQTKYRWGDLHE